MFVAGNFKCGKKSLYKTVVEPFGQIIAVGLQKTTGVPSACFSSGFSMSSSGAISCQGPCKDLARKTLVPQSIEHSGPDGTAPGTGHVQGPACLSLAPSS